MEASAGLVAGSHNRNELVVIRREGESNPKPLQQLRGQVCEICGDEVGLTVDGELFVACNECAFPICRTCYEYGVRRYPSMSAGVHRCLWPPESADALSSLSLTPPA